VQSLITWGESESEVEGMDFVLAPEFTISAESAALYHAAQRLCYKRFSGKREISPSKTLVRESRVKRLLEHRRFGGFLLSAYRCA
jgi:hypothetical protein